jgi:hypothetical protein
MAGMTAFRSATLALALLLAGQLHAQGMPAFTLDSVLTSLQRAAVVAQLGQEAPEVNARLDSLATAVRAEPGAGALTVEQLAAIVTGRKGGFLTVARWKPEAARYATSPAMRDALFRLARIGSSSIEPRLDDRVSREDARVLLAPLSALQSAVLRMSQGWNEDRLRRVELKYGPDAPTLNGLEVLLNYGAQWVPGLRPRADGTPSRYEIVAAYRTLDVSATPSLDTARVVASARLGLRSYFWNPDWGTGNRLRRLIKPRHMSLGLVLVGPSEKPLVRAWGPDHRRGVFAGWGDLHAAYVLESPRRILVGTSAKLVPYGF